MNVISYLFVLLAAMLWGTVGTTQTYLQEGISPIAVASMRSAIGGGVLLIVVLMMGKIRFRCWSWKWTILAALTIAIFQSLFFTSVRFTGVAISTVVTIGSSPMFSGMMEWLFFKKRPNRVWSVATMMAIVGCALLFVNKGETTVHPFGVLLALCAGAMFALYTSCSKQLTEREATLPAVAMTFSLCALFLFPFSKEGVTWVFTLQNIWPMLFMALAATSLAYVLFLAGLEKISPSSAVTLSLAEPLTATLLGVFLLGESLSVTSFIGVMFMLGGIIVLTFSSRKNKDNVKVDEKLLKVKP